MLVQNLFVVKTRMGNLTENANKINYENKPKL